MDLLNYFNKINLKEIERFLEDKQEENLTLEFKTVNHPYLEYPNRNDDKKNISKCLSGFANSNGGIIIWGIKAKENESKQDVAFEMRPIKELTKLLNLLNRLEGQATTPIISGILHKKIEISRDFGYIKSYIPQSENAPHMANYAEKHYYKRSGDSFYQCEHYDIVDMLSRKKTPILDLEIQIIGKKLQGGKIFYEFLISIKNTSVAIAKYPYLALNTTKELKNEYYGVDGNRSTGLTKVKNNSLYRYNYQGGVDTVIYPESILQVDKFKLELFASSDPPELVIDYLIVAENAKNKRGKIVFTSKDLNDASYTL